MGASPAVLSLQVFLALGELLLSCNWAVVADILLVGVGCGKSRSRAFLGGGKLVLSTQGWPFAVGEAMG